jgi:hypothetical protein
LEFTKASNNCPALLATDGGVHNTGDCGANWRITGTGTGGYDALQVYEVTGQLHPDHIDEYFGTQDNNLFASPDSGATWPGTVGNEGFHIQAVRSTPSHSGQIITMVGCSDSTCSNVKTEAHFANQSAWNDPPGGCCNPFVVEPGVYFQFSERNPPQVELFFSSMTDNNWSVVNSPSGTTLSINQSLAGFPRLSGTAGHPVIYTGVLKPGLSASGDTIAGLIRIDHARTNSAVVTAADNGLSNIGQFCDGQGSFVCDPVWGVDPNDPSRIIAADIGRQAMMVSHDGGATWRPDMRLTDLVTSGGTLLFNVAQNQQPNRPGVGSQVHAIGFDPDDANHILVGTEAAGIIESTDGGSTWTTIPSSDFFITGITSFFFERNHTVLVSTYGRGLWELTGIGKWPPPVTCTDQLGHPVDCRTKFVNPATGSLIYPHDVCPHPPEPPTCQFVQPSFGDFRNIIIDKEGTLTGLWIASKSLRGYDANLKQIPVKLPTRMVTKYGEFQGCPECRHILREGGVLDGLVMDGKRVLAVVAHYRKPKKIQKFARVVPAMAQKGQPYVQLRGTVPITGQTVVFSGDTLSVYGSGFCYGPGCGAVILRIGQRTIEKELEVEPGGGFHTTVVISEPPGRYLLTATQKTMQGELKDGKFLSVGMADRK